MLCDQYVCNVCKRSRFLGVGRLVVSTMQN